MPLLCLSLEAPHALRLSFSYLSISYIGKTEAIYHWGPIDVNRLDLPLFVSPLVSRLARSPAAMHTHHILIPTIKTNTSRQDV